MKIHKRAYLSHSSQSLSQDMTKILTNFCTLHDGLFKRKGLVIEKKLPEVVEILTLNNFAL